MEIGNNSYNYNVDFFSRVNTQQQSPVQQDTEQDIRGVEKNESSTESKNNPEQESENSAELTSEEKAVVTELKNIDAKVRAHEAAHQSGPAATGGANFTYSKGPDGIMYAVGGEVPVRIETGSSPEESISNLQGVIATALAPADPSPQDIAIASKARVMMIQAQQELAQEIQEKISNSDEYTQNAINQYEQNNSSEDEQNNTDITA